MERMPRGRAGLTLVELLVVVTIVGMLVALLLPAVQRGREFARRTSCHSHQSELARALQHFENSNGCYPGYRNRQAVHPAKGEVDTGWVFPLLPALGRGDLHETYGAGGTLAGQKPTAHLELLVCPSDVLAESRSVAAPLSYAVNCGLEDLPDNAARQAIVPRDLAANGVFHDHVPVSPFSNARRAVPMTKVDAGLLQRGDGASQTIMLTDNVDAAAWTDRVESKVGLVWHAEVADVPDLQGIAPPAPPPGARINELAGMAQSERDAAKRIRYARPASFHPGGVVVAFCDGRTEFLSEEIEYAVYAQLMTPVSRHAARLDPQTGHRVTVKRTFVQARRSRSRAGCGVARVGIYGEEVGGRRVRWIVRCEAVMRNDYRERVADATRLQAPFNGSGSGSWCNAAPANCSM